AGELIQTDQFGQPAERLGGPAQQALQDLLDLITEALTRLGILRSLVAEPEGILTRRPFARSSRRAKPPIKQRLPRLHGSGLVVVAGDALDFFLRAEEHRHPLVQGLGLDVEDALAAVGGRAASLFD